jgi:hypothetical protein
MDEFDSLQFKRNYNGLQSKIGRRKRRKEGEKVVAVS